MVVEFTSKIMGYCVDFAHIKVRTEEGDLAYKAEKNNIDIGLLERNTTD